MIFVLFRNKENEKTLSRKLSKVFSNFSLDKLSSCSCFSCNIFESVNYRTENKNHLADALFAFLFYLISQKLDCLMQLIIFLNHLFVIRVELIVFSFEILFRFLNQFHTNRSMMFVCSFFLLSLKSSLCSTIRISFSYLSRNSSHKFCNCETLRSLNWQRMRSLFNWFCVSWNWLTGVE